MFRNAETVVHVVARLPPDHQLGLESLATARSLLDHRHLGQQSPEDGFPATARRRLHWLGERVSDPFNAFPSDRINDKGCVVVVERRAGAVGQHVSHSIFVRVIHPLLDEDRPVPLPTTESPNSLGCDGRL